MVSHFLGDADDTEALRSGGTRVQGDQAKIHALDSRSLGLGFTLRSSSPRGQSDGGGGPTVDAEIISTNKLGAGLEENRMQITRDQEGVATEDSQRI